MFNFREGMFCYVSIFVLRVLSFMYIVRISFIGLRFLRLKTRQSLPSITLIFQAFIGILVTSSIILPADLTYFSPGLTLVRVTAIFLTFNKTLVSYESFAARRNKSFISPHFDNVLFIKRF